MGPINRFFQNLFSGSSASKQQPKVKSESSLLQKVLTAVKGSKEAEVPKVKRDAFPPSQDENAKFEKVPESILSHLEEEGDSEATTEDIPSYETTDLGWDDTQIDELPWKEEFQIEESAQDSVPEILESAQEEKIWQQSQKVNAKAKFVFFAQGATKAVHRLDGDKKRLFMSPRKNVISLLTTLRRRELRGEFSKIKKIQERLIELKLKDEFLEQKDTKLIKLLVSNKRYNLEQLVNMDAPQLARALKVKQAKAERIVDLLNSLKDRGIEIEKVGENLGLQLYEADIPEMVAGDYTLVATKGKDFEKLISGHRISFEQKLDLCYQLLQGMRDLHALGYTHGDLKLDNIVVYKKGNSYKLQIIDFGKTGEGIFKTGNPRFAGLEGIATSQEEAFTGGLLLIAILEKALLSAKKDMLLEVPAEKIDPSAQLSPNYPRVGIEKAVILHRDFPNRETKKLKGKIVVFGRRLNQMIKHKVNITDKRDYSSAESFVHQYADELGKKLQKQVDSQEDSDEEVIAEQKYQVDAVIDIIKGLTKVPAANRLSIAKAVAQWETDVLPIEDN